MNNIYNVSSTRITNSNSFIDSNIENSLNKANDDTIEDVTSKDSIEISQNNENIINKKKALDAFNDTISKHNNASLLYCILSDSMKDFGYSVPYFTSDGSNNSEFLPFIDNIKSFVNDLLSGKIPFSQYGAAPLTTDFLDFCDDFKKDLINGDPSIKISENNSNIKDLFGAKKNYDVYIKDDLDKDISHWYSLIADMMKKDSYNTPDFIFDDNSGKNNFPAFIDNMKNYASSLINEDNSNQYASNIPPITTDFLDFCDSFKERLIQYDCK